MNHSELCQYSIKLIESLKSLDVENKLDYPMIEKAIFWARKYHDGQFRENGEPYYIRRLEIAYSVSKYNLTTNVIVGSILQYILENSEVTLAMILENFNWRITDIVDQLTRDRSE